MPLVGALHFERIMTEDEQDFLRVVEAVCQRPALHLGNHYNFRRIVAFLSAYALGFSAEAKRTFVPFGQFQKLLERRDGFSHPAWRWWRHYLHYKGSEQAAIRDFSSFLRGVFEAPESVIVEAPGTEPDGAPPASPLTAWYERHAEQCDEPNAGYLPHRLS